jgi:hypothetical protein
MHDDLHFESFKDEPPDPLTVTVTGYENADDNETLTNVVAVAAVIWTKEGFVLFDSTCLDDDTWGEALAVLASKAYTRAGLEVPRSNET